jgi:hypothetical protein
VPRNFPEIDLDEPSIRSLPYVYISRSTFTCTSRLSRISFIYYRRPSLPQMRFFSLEPLNLDLMTTKNDQTMVSNSTYPSLFPPRRGSSDQIEFRRLIQQVRGLSSLCSDVLRRPPAQCFPCHSRHRLKNTSPWRDSVPTSSFAL